MRIQRKETENIVFKYFKAKYNMSIDLSRNSLKTFFCP